jgi:hypothetical protein
MSTSKTDNYEHDNENYEQKNAFFSDSKTYNNHIHGEQNAEDKM